MNMSAEVLIPMEDEESGLKSDFRFNNNVASSHVYIRMGFLRKVYGLLSVQLFLTTIVAGVFAYVSPINQFIFGNPELVILFLPISIGLIIALHFKRHHFPVNYILLVAFTVVQSITIGVVVSVYEVKSVLNALFFTTIITVSLTLYTLQSKKDFSKLGVGLLMCLMVVFGMTLLNVFVGSEGMDLVIGGLAAILFSLYIVYDTHMMMHKLSPEEYILATINLYLDIVNLFLELLRIFGERKN